eukprot:1492744-Pleurochrysis_carterae.AAC.1
MASEDVHSDIEEAIDVEEEAQIKTLGENWATAAQQLATSQLEEASKICEKLRHQLARERRNNATVKSQLEEKTAAVEALRQEVDAASKRALSQSE